MAVIIIGRILLPCCCGGSPRSRNTHIFHGLCLPFSSFISVCTVFDVANANTHTDDYYADVLGRFSPPRVDSTVLTLEGCVLGLLFLKAANRIKRGISLFGRNGSEEIRMHAAPFSVAFFGQGSCLSIPSQWQYWMMNKLYSIQIVENVFLEGDYELPSLLDAQSIDTNVLIL